MLTARKLSLALPLLAWGCGLSGKKVSVDDLVQPRQGTWGIYFRDLETGETVELSSSAVFHAASTMKVLVLIKLFQDIEAGKSSLEEKVLVEDTFPSAVSGQFQTEPSTPEMREATGTITP